MLSYLMKRLSLASLCLVRYSQTNVHYPTEAFSFDAVEAVERAAGLELFSEALKRSSKHICQTTKCELLVKRFDDAQKGKKPDMRRAVSAPR